MPDPIVIPPGAGEVIGDAPDRRVEILSGVPALSATWSRFGPGRDGADLHVHRRHTDCFYVLDGEFTLRLGPAGRPIAVPAGTLVRVPPMVVHGFRNASDAELRYLNLHAPGRGFADYLRAMRDGRPFAYDQFEPPPDGGRDPADAAIGEHEVLADGPDLHVALLADVEELAVAELRAAPGTALPQAHGDRDHVASLHVLEGELALRAGATELHASAGTWVQLPRGGAPALAVAGDAPARVLSMHTPGGGFAAALRAATATAVAQALS